MMKKTLVFALSLMMVAVFAVGFFAVKLKVADYVAAITTPMMPWNVTE